MIYLSRVYSFKEPKGSFVLGFDISGKCIYFPDRYKAFRGSDLQDVISRAEKAGWSYNECENNIQNVVKWFNSLPKSVKK